MMQATEHPEGSHVAEHAWSGSASHRRACRSAVCCDAELSAAALGRSLAAPVSPTQVRALGLRPQLCLSTFCGYGGAPLADDSI
jgi:hypothetical protein